MNFHDFPINQSIIKEFFHNGEEREYCFKRIYLTKIIRKVRSEPTDPMIKGKYFETKCLGKSSGYNINDLPRKKLTKKDLAENAVRATEKKPLLLGEKFIDHIRIDDQIGRFRALCDKYRIIITKENVQVELKTIWEHDPDVMLKAELDVFPTTILIEDELEAAIIDLKLTADIHSVYGEYCYGKPEYLDLIQAKMYHYIVRNINTKLNPHVGPLITSSVKSLIEQDRILFLLWVFNYKGTELDDKFIQVKWDKNKEAELHESIRKTVGVIEMGERTGWPTNPVYSLCKSCPVKACPDRNKIQTV